MPELHIEPGLSIYYQDTNEISSNRVLLLHGLGATCSSWQLQVPSLVDAGYRVVAPDMRGFGSSSYPGGQNNPKSMAGDIERLIEKLSLNRIHVVGISLGGTVALQLATTRPDLIKSLVLTNSFAKLHPNRPSIYIFYLVRLLLVHLFDINTQATFVAERLFPKSGQEDLKNIFREQVLIV